MFQTATGWWYPQSTRLGLWIIVPFTLLYTLANAFILILCWFPSDLGQREQILPTFVGPAVGTGLSVLGVVFWFFDLHLLPHFGYRMEAEERREGYVVHLRFQVSYRTTVSTYHILLGISALMHSLHCSDTSLDVRCRFFNFWIGCGAKSGK